MVIPDDIEKNLEKTLASFRTLEKQMLDQIAKIPSLTPTHRKPLKKHKGSASITSANAVIIEFNTLAEAEKFYKELDKWA